KTIIKSQLNYFSFLTILLGGIGIGFLSIYFIKKENEIGYQLFIGIILLIIGIYFIYRALITDIIELTKKELIFKSIFGRTKKTIPLSELNSFNEIRKYNAKYKSEPGYMEWSDLTLFTKDKNYKISSTTYLNYEQLKKKITKDLIRNKK